ncbi:hypothetical protein IDH28_03645 [Pelagibacterales bacterium SAG-MED31]|nr:hypothetical protein [Pelagibacterales bacterium SAG-MED31]
MIKLFIFIFIFLNSVNASELSTEEINYFEITDLNNDGFVSIDEINQSLNLVFQLIDLNKDEKISLDELEELKEIYNIFLFQ